MPDVICCCGCEVRVAVGDAMGEEPVRCPECGAELGPSLRDSLRGGDVPAGTVVALAPAAAVPSAWRRQFASATFSVLVHLAVLLPLGLLVVQPVVQPFLDTVIVSTEFRQAGETAEDLGVAGALTADLTVIRTDVGAMSSTSAAVNQLVRPEKLTGFKVTAPSTDPSRQQFSATVPELPSASSLLSPVKSARPASDPVRGGLKQGNGAGHAAEGVLGGIAQEIGHGPVQVVWLMDASISMNADRVELASRLFPFYKEMAKRNRTEGGVLMSSVVRFGATPQELVHSTKNFEQVTQAVAAQQDDPSGLENVMSAVQYCLKQQARWKGTLIIVLWTDESGDDIGLLEPTIQLCRKQDAIVHVVGPAAVFGSERGHHAWKDPQTGLRFMLQVKRGPETSLPERLMLPYWHRGNFPPAEMGGNLVADGLNRGGGPMREGIMSGFGPYALTRLALQTGGSFTILSRPGDPPVPDLEMMRPYAPDYAAADECYADTQGRPFRKAISDATLVLYKSPRLETPPQTFLFSRQNYYPVAAFVGYQTPEVFRPVFRENLLTAIKGSRAESLYLEQAIQFFEAEDLEPLYGQETSPRWKAWYDLNYGRLLANSVRHREYQLACESILRDGGLDPATNHVVFDATSRYLGGRLSEGRAVEARRLLERCRDENPGTPWALLAEDELSNELGTIGRQVVIPPPPPPRPSRGPVTVPKPTPPINFPRL